MKKKGFYIILFLSIVLITTNAFWITKVRDAHTMMEKEDNPLPQEEKIPLAVVEDNKEGEGGHHEQRKEEETALTEEKISISEQKIEEGFLLSEATQKIKMKRPLEGEIGMNYAKDTLIYSKTLDQYTTHYGMDILAPENTPVVAALEGKAIKVTSGSGFGKEIVLSHEGNIRTRYANLSTTDMVKIGDHIQKGQIISGVGRTALFEILEKPHLHFEILVNGENVDPNQFLIFQK